jgi:hypothetical protein
MWQCVKCGEKLEDSFDACWSCGTSRDGIQDESQAKAKHEREKSSFCPACGGKLPEEGARNFCPKCGSKLPDGDAPPGQGDGLSSAGSHSGGRVARAVGFGLGGVAIGLVCVLIGVFVGILICMGMLHDFLGGLGFGK